QNSYWSSDKRRFFEQLRLMENSGHENESKEFLSQPSPKTLDELRKVTEASIKDLGNRIKDLAGSLDKFEHEKAKDYNRKFVQIAAQVNLSITGGPGHGAGLPMLYQDSALLAAGEWLQRGPPPETVDIRMVRDELGLTHQGM